ncbi:MAG TPA: hypothetical protein VFK45_09255 [Gammaproteobacteria bacterium]|nr:hypothetical protein [Gammaproteobacteria bacterium]
MMTEGEFFAAMDAAVLRWTANRTGEVFGVRHFDQAKENDCHANAEKYASLNGGIVVRGFLIQPLDGWAFVWVISHSVVRTNQGLEDVTLAASQLRGGLTFFSIEPMTEGYLEWARKYPRERRPVPQISLDS